MTENMQEVRDALLSSFPNSFINQNDEFVAHELTNQYIILSNCNTPEDVACKVLEWFSRPAYKTCPFSRKWRNAEFHKFMLDGINEFLDTRFTEEDISFIYETLGNAVCHDLTVEFVQNGMSIDWLRKKTNV